MRDHGVLDKEVFAPRFEQSLLSSVVTLFCKDICWNKTSPLVHCAADVVLSQSTEVCSFWLPRELVFYLFFNILLCVLIFVSSSIASDVNLGYKNSATSILETESKTRFKEQQNVNQIYISITKIFGKLLLKKCSVSLGVNSIVGSSKKKRSWRNPSNKVNCTNHPVYQRRVTPCQQKDRRKGRIIIIRKKEMERHHSPKDGGARQHHTKKGEIATHKRRERKISPSPIWKGRSQTLVHQLLCSLLPSKQIPFTLHPTKIHCVRKTNNHISQMYCFHKATTTRQKNERHHHAKEWARQRRQQHTKGGKGEDTTTQKGEERSQALHRLEPVSYVCYFPSNQIHWHYSQLLRFELIGYI